MTVTGDPLDSGPFAAMSDDELFAAIRTAEAPDARRAAAWAFWVRHEIEIRRVAGTAARKWRPRDHEAQEFEIHVVQCIQEKLADQGGLAKCPAFVPWLAWLGRVSANAALDLGRRHRARPQHGRSVDVTEVGLPSATDSPEHRAMRGERRARTWPRCASATESPEHRAMRAEASRTLRDVMMRVGSRPGWDRRVRALRMVTEGSRVSDVAIYFDVSQTTIFTWLKSVRTALEDELKSQYGISRLEDLLPESKQ